MTRSDTSSTRFLPLLLSLLGVAAGLAWLFFLNHRFFFIDDRQAQYFPYGLIIRDMLLKGEFPFLTTRTFYGGALWLDWQYGIYNPVSLLMDLMIDPQHLERSGFLFALVSNLLLAAGAYSLGRAYALERGWAALFALLVGLNMYIVYRGSGIWQPGVTSLAWMLFAWAALKRLAAAKENIAPRALLSAVCIYMMVSAGWPHTNIAFALVAGCLIVEEKLKKKNGRPLRLIYAGLLGGALCLPVVAPVLAAFPWTARAAMPDNPLFHPRAFDLLNLSNPLWQPLMTNGAPGPQPLLFLAWFALPALALVDWKHTRWQRLVPLVGLAYVFFVLADADIGAALMLRYPVRWAPFFHICGLLALLSILQESPLVLSRRHMQWAFALLAAPMLVSFALHPSMPATALGAAVACLGALGLWIRKPANAPLLLGAASFIVAALVFAAYPRNTDAIDWGKHDATAASAESPPSAPVAYTITDTADHYIPDGAQDERDFMIAAMGAYFNADTLNGYTSLGQKGLEQLMHCSAYTFILCAYHPDALTAREPETGASYLDLFKVDRIVATKKDGLAALMKNHEPPGWTESGGKLTVAFERKKKNELPGTLSWHSPSLAISGPAALAANGEMLHLKNGTKPGLLVFARLYYPGFRATLDGTALTVRPVRDTLVGVEVPPSAAGEMTLSFTPPLLWPCVAIAALALVLWLFFAFRERQNPNM